MARVTYGESVTEYAGSIGGITYQKNASGNIARLRPNPTVNPTSLQAGYQTNMAYLVSFWPTLSQADKDLWDAFAIAHDHTTPWGEVKTLSGYQWFISCNLICLAAHELILSSPPAWLNLSPPETFTLTATSTYLRCNWSPTYNPAFFLTIYLSLPLRQSSLKLRRSLFFRGFSSFQPALDTLVLTSQFESLVNVTWSSFFAAANCSIICRLVESLPAYGQTSSFTSAIVKIN
jgi:hypothetical protein